MKKKFFLLLVFMIAVKFQTLQSQHQFVTDLCFDEEVTDQISVTSDIEIQSLNILDKLKFQTKKYVKKNHEYINNTGNTTRDIYFVSHENMFPKWYTHPSMLRNDETGIKSYFQEDNQLLPDGWTGGIKSETKHGNYIIDANTRERYLYQPYSELAQSTYQSWNTFIKTSGFLKRYTFSYPSDSDLEHLETEGYSVSKNENIIIVKNEVNLKVWDIGNKNHVRQTIENNLVTKTTKTHFKYYEEFDTYLIESTVNITPETFSNGDCYQSIITTAYSNYSSRCNQRIADNRNIESENILTKTGDLSIFPNPSYDNITIKVPNFELESTLQVTDVNGEALIYRKIKKDQKVVKLNISDFPSGIYIARWTCGKEIYSSKFVKQ